MKLINEEKLKKIKRQLMVFGDGSFEFETKDIEELLRSYEHVLKEIVQIIKKSRLIVK